MVNVVTLSKRKLYRRKKKLLKALRRTEGWPGWVQMCCGAWCSDGPSHEAEKQLEELMNVCFLLGERWREVVSAEA